MERIPEPELMLEALQVRAYAEANFEEPHARVIAMFQASFEDWAGQGTVLDLGCGPGDIAFRFARAYPECRVDAFDGSEPMLAEGRARLGVSGLSDRVTFHQVLFPTEPGPRPRYDGIISNSLLHHLHDPQIFWEEIKRYAKPGAPLFIVDLLRPDTLESAMALRDQYTQGEPEVLRKDFFNSLCAAFTLEELECQLRTAGLSFLDVQVVSDRHVLIKGRYQAPKS